jgi:hypothetical protein
VFVTIRLRVRTAPVLALVVVIVVAGLVTRAREYDFARGWSSPLAASASDPVNMIPVTKLDNMRFVFISLFFGSRHWT